MNAEDTQLAVTVEQAAAGPDELQVTVENRSESPVQFDPAALTGISLNGVDNTYNRNLRYEAVAGEPVRIAPHDSYTFTLSLADTVRPQPGPGRYQIVLRYLIAGELCSSDPLTINLPGAEP